MMKWFFGRIEVGYFAALLIIVGAADTRASEFSRRVECETTPIGAAGNPTDARVLILGVLPLGTNPVAPLDFKILQILGKNKELRVGLNFSTFPEVDENQFETDILAYDIDSHSYYKKARVSIDLTSGRGRLESSVDSYILGSFDLSRCRLIYE